MMDPHCGAVNIVHEAEEMEGGDGRRREERFDLL
jgi:hypothetical protein